METHNTKGQRCPIQEGEADHPAVKDCIKQLSRNRWLLGPSLICERDIESNNFSTYFITSDDESILEWSPIDPQEGPIQLVRCIQGQATWKIDDWAYFKTKNWTQKMGLEYATIQFVRENTPEIPTPTVLQHYVDESAHRSFLLISSIPGEDLNEAWKTLNGNQKNEIVEQVAKCIDTLSKLTSERLESADKKWLWEPYLATRQVLLSYPTTAINTKEVLCSNLLNPDESSEYEKIWGKVQNEFVFCHADLGPTNIKIMVNEKGGIHLTGLLDWEIAGFFPKGWICTKFYVSCGLAFDWDGEKGEAEWPMRLRMLLKKKGYQAFPHKQKTWSKDILSRMR